jgi:tryptophan synthase alpha chain
MTSTSDSKPGASIAAAIRAARAGGAPALVAYLTAGYPSPERFAEHVHALARAAQAVEIGVPFSDPMADGITIQRSSQAALARGVTLRWILRELRAMGPINAPVLLMSYLNPLLAFGFDELPEALAQAGVAGLIVPDLPLDECKPLHDALGPKRIALVQMVTPVTRASRLEELCRESEGFVYAVTMTGTTGKSAAIPAEVLRYLDRVRALAAAPVCAGFGIRSAAQVAALKDMSTASSSARRSWRCSRAVPILRHGSRVCVRNKRNRRVACRARPL